MKYKQNVDDKLVMLNNQNRDILLSKYTVDTANQNEEFLAVKSMRYEKCQHGSTNKATNILCNDNIKILQLKKIGNNFSTGSNNSGLSVRTLTQGTETPRKKEGVSCEPILTHTTKYNLFSEELTTPPPTDKLQKLFESASESTLSSYTPLISDLSDSSVLQKVRHYNTSNSSVLSSNQEEPQTEGAVFPRPWDDEKYKELQQLQRINENKQWVEKWLHYQTKSPLHNILFHERYSKQYHFKPSPTRCRYVPTNTDIVELKEQVPSIYLTQECQRQQQAYILRENTIRPWHLTLVRPERSRSRNNADTRIKLHKQACRRITRVSCPTVIPKFFPDLIGSENPELKTTPIQLSNRKDTPLLKQLSLRNNRHGLWKNKLHLQDRQIKTPTLINRKVDKLSRTANNGKGIKLEAPKFKKITAARLQAFFMNTTDANMWPLEKYARWDGNRWHQMDSNESQLCLLVENMQLLVIQSGTVIESVGLVSGAGQLRGVWKDRILVIIIKHDTTSRRFRVKFAATDYNSATSSCKACVTILSKYIHMYDSTESNSAESITITDLYNNFMKTEASAGNTIVGCLTPEPLPPDFPLDKTVQLCILDPGFPELVGRVEAALQQMLL